jgi:FkbM family methyltransferase
MKAWLVDLIVAYIRHTPPHPGRGILGKLAWWLQPKEVPAEPLPGIKVKVRLCSSAETALFGGRFEAHRESEVFAGRLKEGMTVFDIGANLGVYALSFAQRVGPTGRIYAFEPVPATFARLKEHIALNGATNIIPVPFALFDREGRMEMWVDEEWHGEKSFFRQPKKKSMPLLVPVTTIDLFVNREGIERVDAIKLDAEGAELAIVRGADQTLRRDKPLLMVEINETTLTAAKTTPDELFATIVSYGYDAFVIRHGKTLPTDKVVKPYGYEPHYRYDNYLFVPR